MQKSMNILFVSSLFPFPADKGAKIRLLQLMRALCPRHKVSLLAFHSRNERSHVESPFASGEMAIHSVPPSKLEGLINCMKAVASSKPLQVGYCESIELRKTLRELTRENKFDFVIIHLLRMADYAREVENSRVILDIGDAVSQYLKRSMEFRKLLWERVLLRSEYGRVLKYERQCVSTFCCTFVSSEADKAVLERTCLGANLAVIPNAVDLEYLVPSGERMSKPRVVFVGNFSYNPNVDAVKAFCGEVLPIIWKEKPDLTFYAVGTSPPKSVRALAANPRIVVTGTVPDIRTYLTRGSVFVCPVRFGGGTKFKVLEAMAMGLSVVSTEVGSEGIDVTDGKELFVVRNPHEFAQRVLQLANDPDLNLNMGGAARDTMESRYDQRIVANSLEKLLIQLRGSAP
jgi:polysaccharide biosynthesis protein PslH